MSDPLPVGGLMVGSETYSLAQVCAICGVHTQRLVELVSFGIVAPAGAQPEHWRFSESALHRAKKALRLHRDLDLDLQGLGLALELLDEIERLQALAARAQP